MTTNSNSSPDYFLFSSFQLTIINRLCVQRQHWPLKKALGPQMVFFFFFFSLLLQYSNFFYNTKTLCTRNDDATTCTGTTTSRRRMQTILTTNLKSGQTGHETRIRLKLQVGFSFTKCHLQLYLLLTKCTRILQRRLGRQGLRHVRHVSNLG